MLTLSLALAGALAGALTGALALAPPPVAPIDVFPGDPAALQDAIDAAPSGSVILVHGGTYDPITITKPLDIVAEPRAFLSVQLDCPGVTVKTLVQLAGPGSGRATLNNFGVSGSADGFFYCGNPQPLIQGGGFDEFWLLDSTIAADWASLSGAAPGAPALSTSVPTVVISGSTVRPLPADTDFGPGYPQPPAIDAPSSTVIVTHSTVRGGAYTLISSFTCPPTSIADAAEGVVCNLLFQSGSTVEGGAAGQWICASGPGTGTIPAGPPYDANLATDIFANLTPQGPPLRGTTWNVDAVATASGGFLFLNHDTAPVEYKPGLGWDFLTITETFFTTVVPGGASVQSFVVPNVVDLVGFELGLELYDFDIGLFGGPLITQIR